MKKLIAILFFTSCAVLSYLFFVQRTFINPYPVVCDLVAQKIFLDSDSVKKWHHRCLLRQRLVTPFSSKKLILKDVNNVLSLLNVSHLQIFDRNEVRSIWLGESKETGIEADYVDSQLVVFKIHPHSPASKAGILRGDIIVALNGEQPNPWEVQSESGDYVIERNKIRRHVLLTTDVFQRDEEISVQKLPRGVHIHIPSFQARFFSPEKNQLLKQALVSANNVVVDLRGNAGGNFVAGLRFLSLFLCPSELVGRLVRSQSEQRQPLTLPDDLDDEIQLSILNKSDEVLLRTPAQAACYRGKIRVLVDARTASVAEMVAQALKEFRQARILGNASRGQLLVGVWYPVRELGSGVEISIPEAYYESAQKRRIEGRGVELDKVLYYDIDELQAGTDSWVRQALD